jgi:tyrosine-specific transport protein
MTKKQTGAIMLVAGTCIGSGMIALPMTLAKIGIIPSVIFMVGIWLMMYFSSLVTIELNLKAGKGLALGSLGRKFSGKIAEVLGTSSFKILSYALVAVYLYAGSSVIKTLLESSFLEEYSFNYILNIFALLSALVFLLPIKLIDYANRFLFIGLLVVIAILIIGLVTIINWSNLPLISSGCSDIKAWQIIVPVVFTAFGFQGSCHSFANYCNLDAKVLKKALFWGSFIPMLVYIIWNSSALAVVYDNNPNFYHQIIEGKVEVGDLIKELSHIAKWQSMQILVWWITILAIITSLLGVGIGLYESLKEMLPSSGLASIATVFPAYLVALLVPNAFIAVLGFAGMILAIIAIIIPVYLFTKANIKTPHYKILSNKYLLASLMFIGILIVLSQFF